LTRQFTRVTQADGTIRNEAAMPVGELGKGQVVHYELIDGPQILDTVYLVKSRPTEESADIYPTSQYGSLTPREARTTTQTIRTCAHC
jgi:hypothetical protein